MNVLLRVFAMVALAGLAAAGASGVGEVYDHFREAPVDFSEEDLHLLADAFYVQAHFDEAQKASLLAGIQNTLVNATAQTGQIGGLIDSTQGLIKVVKNAAGQLSNPGNMVTNALKSGWGKLFGRLLQANGAGNVAQFVDNLETKVAEAQTQQKTVTKALDNSSKFLGVLQGVGQLLGGNSTGFKNAIAQWVPSWFGGHRLDSAQLADLLANRHLAAKHDWSLGPLRFGENNAAPNDTNAQAPQNPQANALTGKIVDYFKSGLLKGGSSGNGQSSFTSALSNLFQTAGAHLEHLSQKPDTSYGRHRKSLFEREKATRRLTRMAESLKDSARYLNSVDDSSVNFGRLENHLYDLVQEGGLTGKAYLRGVETLKCILLHQNCPEIKVIPSGYTKTVYFGQDTATQTKVLNGAGAGAQAQAQANQLVNTGTDVRVQAVPLNGDGSAVAGDNSIHVQPGFLAGGAWNIDSVAQSNGFNPSQGNEAIIVQNESPVNSLPPVSDVVSGVQYTTVINQPPTDHTNTDFVIPKTVPVSTLEVENPPSAFVSLPQTTTTTTVTTVNLDNGTAQVQPTPNA